MLSSSPAGPLRAGAAAARRQTESPGFDRRRRALSSKPPSRFAIKVPDEERGEILRLERLLHAWIGWLDRLCLRCCGMLTLIHTIDCALRFFLSRGPRLPIDYLLYFLQLDKMNGCLNLFLPLCLHG